MKTKRKLLNPRWRKIIADLWEGKSRTLLVVASIAVGAFAVGAIATSYFILGEDVDVSYASILPANIEMVTTPFESDFLRSVEEIPGVERAEGRQSLGVRLSKDGLSWLSINLQALGDTDSMQINLLKPVSGEIYPGEHELVIGFEMMRDTGFRTGDQLLVQLDDGTQRTIRVAGEVGDLTFSHDPMGTQRGFVTEDTMTWLGGSALFDRLLVRVSEKGNDLDFVQEVADRVEKKVEKNGGTVLRSSIYRSDDFPMAEMALAVFGIMGLLGALVVLLSTSLIVNTLNALFAQHLRQIGVMKLVGARGRQVLIMYLLTILAYALLALFIAVPLGAWAGYELAVMMGNMFNATLQGFRLVPAAIAIQVVVAIFVPLAAGFIPVRNGSRISVLRAISSDHNTDQTTPSGFAAGLNRLGVGLFSRPVLLSIRNTFRRKGRLALTLLTLTTAGAIFIAVFNVRDSMNVYLDELMQHFMADVTLTFDDPYRVTRITQAVMRIPGVEKVEAWSGAAAEILDSDDELLEDLTLIAPPAETSLLKLELLAGRWIQPGEARALVISSPIYNLYPDLQPGDTLRLRVAGGRSDDWTVVGVFSFTEMLGELMAYSDYDYVSELLGSSGQSSSYRIVTKAHDLASQQTITEAIDHQMRSHSLHVRSVEAGQVTRQQSSQAVTILIVFLLSMALLTAFVGSIGLAGTMGMNVLERTREIGVMRAIGAGDAVIVKTVVIEGVLTGLISWLFAWVLSFPISFVMLRIVTEAMMSDPIALSYTLEGVFVWLLVVIALSAIASILPARNATRLTIREVLAYE